ncbi:hypothetical protein DSL72_007574 [Monilinia vaccinii-corymbosi]|uniref:Uncharacterized protein n=1 Tax=Monilinia vaccinii-corymbosi TaxID=61207 RepID=A0A8A3PI55_9HELO|nr:hypothetical protein DSL72_007574 [Monilinia vaccinii-corymbosi]
MTAATSSPTTPSSPSPSPPISKSNLETDISKVEVSSMQVPSQHPELSTILQRDAAKLQAGNISGTIAGLHGLFRSVTSNYHRERAKYIVKLVKDSSGLLKAGVLKLSAKKNSILEVKKKKKKKKSAPIDKSNPLRTLELSEYQSLCDILRKDSETLIRLGDVRGDGYVTSLDSLVESPNVAQRVALLKALERVGRDFDDAGDEKSATSIESPTEGTCGQETNSKPALNDNLKEPMTELERCLLPYKSIATAYINSHQHKHRGGTSSLHTYEAHHTHHTSTCTIKHEEEIYPLHFNPSLLSIFKKCSRLRLFKERQERRVMLWEQYQKGLRRFQINPLLSEDIIKEYGAERYGELEGRLDVRDMRDAASWELTSRHVDDKMCRKSASTFQKRKSPLRNEVLRVLEDPSEKKDKKRKREVDEADDEESRQHAKRFENSGSEMGWLQNYLKEESTRVDAAIQEQKEQKIKRKERREKERKEKKRNVGRGSDCTVYADLE